MKNSLASHCTTCERSCQLMRTPGGGIRREKAPFKICPRPLSYFATSPFLPCPFLFPNFRGRSSIKSAFRSYRVPSFSLFLQEATGKISLSIFLSESGTTMERASGNKKKHGTWDLGQNVCSTVKLLCFLAARSRKKEGGTEGEM